MAPRTMIIHGLVLLMLSADFTSVSAQGRDINKLPASAPTMESLPAPSSQPSEGPRLYLIWYGRWSSTKRQLVYSFIQSLGKMKALSRRDSTPSLKQWWQVATDNHRAPLIRGEVQDEDSSLGRVLDMSATQGSQVVENDAQVLVKKYVMLGQLPLDADGFYFVLTSDKVIVPALCRHDSSSISRDVPGFTISLTPFSRPGDMNKTSTHTIFVGTPSTKPRKDACAKYLPFAPEGGGYIPLKGDPSMQAFLIFFAKAIIAITTRNPLATLLCEDYARYPAVTTNYSEVKMGDSGAYNVIGVNGVRFLVPGVRQGSACVLKPQGMSAPAPSPPPPPPPAVATAPLSLECGASVGRSCYDLSQGFTLCCTNGTCTDDKCSMSEGCDPAFGYCSSTQAPTTSPIPQPAAAPGPSHSGLCGPGFGPCPPGQCCNAMSRGCWSPPTSFCAVGCLPLYGDCHPCGSVDTSNKIVATLARTKKNCIFARQLQETGLADAIEELELKVTIFAPSDAAILNKSESLFSPIGDSSSDMIQYGTIYGRYTLNDLRQHRKRRPISLLDNIRIAIQSDGRQVAVGDGTPPAVVIAPDLFVSDLIAVHGVDQVLLPPKAAVVQQ